MSYGKNLDANLKISSDWDNSIKKTLYQSRTESSPFPPLMINSFLKILIPFQSKLPLGLRNGRRQQT